MFFKTPLNNGVCLMSHLDSLKPLPGGMLNGQDLKQLLQSSPSSVQNLMHLSASRYHFRTPGLFDTERPSYLRLSELIIAQYESRTHQDGTSLVVLDSMDLSLMVSMALRQLSSLPYPAEDSAILLLLGAINLHRHLPDLSIYIWYLYPTQTNPRNNTTRHK